MAPRTFADQAIVLKRHNYGDADRILTIFSRTRGKFSAIAKGVRKLTSRKAPHVELFSHAKLYFASSHQLPIITQAETINQFSQLQSNLESAKLAFHTLEILDKLLLDDQPYPQVFDHLVSYLQLIDEHQLNFEETETQLASFELYLLSQLGFGAPATIAQAQPSFLTINSYIETILDRRLTSLNKFG